MSNIKPTVRKINHCPTLTIDARELHECLNIKKKFSDWIKQFIRLGNFEKDIDFITESRPNESGGKPFKDYFLTKEMAQRISMMARTSESKNVKETISSISEEELPCEHKH